MKGCGDLIKSVVSSGTTWETNQRLSDVGSEVVPCSLNHAPRAFETYQDPSMFGTISMCLLL